MSNVHSNFFCSFFSVNFVYKFFFIGFLYYIIYILYSLVAYSLNQRMWLASFCRDLFSITNKASLTSNPREVECKLWTKGIQKKTGNIKVCSYIYFSKVVLYCTVLYCTVLYCTVLYCTLLYCTVVHCTVLYCTLLHCAVLYRFSDILKQGYNH